MTIKWYFPMEVLGLVEDVSEKYNDGTTYVVSAKCADVFLWMLGGFILMCFTAGIILTLISKTKTSKAARTVSLILLLYAVLLAVGVGPYFQLYPQGAGFVDFSVIEHILDGIYMGICALSVYLGSKIVLITGKIVNKNKTGA
ncbi:MAG: hypothetical protein IKM61_07855 [Eubacteriaceae bacterium]|nr:hypothetical protein [Eubacteriaceae bacterium]